MANHVDPIRLEEQLHSIAVEYCREFFRPYEDVDEKPD